MDPAVEKSSAAKLGECVGQLTACAEGVSSEDVPLCVRSTASGGFKLAASSWRQARHLATRRGSSACTCVMLRAFMGSGGAMQRPLVRGALCDQKVPCGDSVHKQNGHARRSVTPPTGKIMVSTLIPLCDSYAQQCLGTNVQDVCSVALCTAALSPVCTGTNRCHSKPHVACAVSDRCVSPVSL